MQEESYFDEKIDEFVAQFNSLSTNYERLVVANNIIEAKHICKSKLQKADLFRWTRQFIMLSILSDSETASNHFTLSSQNIFERINAFPVSDQIGLLKFTVRELRSRGYFDEADWFEDKLEKVELRDIFSKYKIGLSIEVMIRTSTYNNLTIFVSIFIIFLLYSLLLFPWKDTPLVLFEISYVPYSEYNTLNHLANTAMGFLDIDSDFKIKPINFLGVVMISVIKVVLLLFIYNFLTTKLSKNLER